MLSAMLITDLFRIFDFSNSLVHIGGDIEPGGGE